MAAATTTILWLRHDLRPHDRPALGAARRAERMVPVFCFDDGLINGRHASGPRTQFMLECQFQARYRGLAYGRAQQRFDAWWEGHAGYPLVDAEMRQLRRDGWLPNRARLVVGSFLTKDLAIDWR